MSQGNSSTTGFSENVCLGYKHIIGEKWPSQSFVLKRWGVYGKKAERQREEDSKTQRYTIEICRKVQQAAKINVQQHTV